MTSSIISTAVGAALRVLKQSYAPLKDDTAHKTLFRGPVLDAKLCFHADEEKLERFRSWNSGFLVIAKVLDSFVLMLHPEEGSDEISQSRVLSPSDDLVITFRQASLMVSADASGRDDGKLQIVAQDHESFWAIVICFAQYHLDVLCRRSALESQIDMLRHRELVMKNVMKGVPFTLRYKHGQLVAYVVLALLTVVMALFLRAHISAQSGTHHLLA